MAGLAGKLSKFLASPQGRRITGEALRRAQKLASDPRTRARVQQVASKFNQRGGAPRH